MQLNISPIVEVQKIFIQGEYVKRFDNLQKMYNSFRKLLPENIYYVFQVNEKAGMPTVNMQSENPKTKFMVYIVRIYLW